MNMVPVITAFGNPYLTHEIPNAPTLLRMFDCSADAQRAAVATWLGEKPIRPHAKRPRPRRGARHPGADAAKDHSGLLPEH